jgi:diaminopropionate ammonia-lyase
MTWSPSRAAAPRPRDVVINRNALARVPGASATRDPLEVHRRLPGYAPTKLVECPRLASESRVGTVWVKDESSRLGLPAFKMLGASYGVYRAVVERLGQEPHWDDLDELRVAVAKLLPMTLAAATDGNHGRAVARMARHLGFDARIYVPEGTVAARIAAIESEGATVTVVPGDYDDAVRRSALDESDSCIVVSDTSWPGYDRIPGWVVEGYSTIFAEVSDELVVLGRAEPDVVVVPVGVGALAAATVNHYKGGGVESPPTIVGVEPAGADCVLRSVRASRLVTVPGPHTSIMAGLNCGTPSELAWPLVSRGLDVIVAIDDEPARDAMRALAEVGIVAGETGAAALAGLRSLVLAEDGDALRQVSGLEADASVLLICTEGATDPGAYEAIVGRPADAVRGDALRDTP